MLLVVINSPPCNRIRNPESGIHQSFGLESGIQADKVVGILNPEGWNPESKEKKLLESGIQNLSGFCYMGEVTFIV